MEGGVGQARIAHRWPSKDRAVPPPPCSAASAWEACVRAARGWSAEDGETAGLGLDGRERQETRSCARVGDWGMPRGECRAREPFCRAGDWERCDRDMYLGMFGGRLGGDWDAREGGRWEWSVYYGWRSSHLADLSSPSSLELRPVSSSRAPSSAHPSALLQALDYSCLFLCLYRRPSPPRPTLLPSPLTTSRTTFRLLST